MLTRCLMCGFVFVVWCVPSAEGTASFLTAILEDGIPDTTFDGTTLRISQSGFSSIDPLTLHSSASILNDELINVEFFLEIDFLTEAILPNIGDFGWFTDGTFSVQFDYLGDTFTLAGDIDRMIVDISGAGSNPEPRSFFDFDGVFSPTVTNMPGGFEWVVPAAASFSSIRGDIQIAEDLSTWDWSNPTPWSASAESFFIDLAPDCRFPSTGDCIPEIPEPASLYLLMTGVIVMLLRKR